MYKYIILGEPRAWKRPGGQMHRYDTQKHDKLVVGNIIRQQHPDIIFTKPLSLDLSFFIKHPKYNPKKEAQIIGKPCPSRPDLDNYIKFLLDALTGILFDDDNIIFSISAKKVYDPEPRTEMLLEEWK